MKLLVIGRNGQVGFELQRALAPLGEVIGTDRGTCDVASADSVRKAIRTHAPQVIVNASAYTAVDKAESEPDLAFAVNATGPGVMAEEATRLGALLVHYSTDYVYDGTKLAPYVETDATNPQSVYGRSKLAGEDAIRAAHARHIILRTSWVFGAHGGNFLKTILRLAGERDTLRVVADQVGAPTSAALIADTTAQLLISAASDTAAAGNLYGTYHLSASGEASWHDYACHIVREATRLGWPLKLSADNIAPIPASEYPLPAPRPANSRLDTAKLRGVLGAALPDWREGADRVLNQLRALAA